MLRLHQHPASGGWAQEAGTILPICALCRYTSGWGLQGIMPKGSPIISEALAVEGRGSELFDVMCANDLEGIMCKRLAEPYAPRARWIKVKNRNYSQAEGRSDLFNGPRQKLDEPHHWRLQR